jgi:FKBP-type peptidyl-prolyl cis-trans isomerase FklB
MENIMKLKPMVFALAGLMTTAVFAADAASDLTSNQQMVSYSIGVDLGRNMAKQKLDLDINSLSAGLKDGFSGTQLKLSEDKMKEVLMSFQKEFVAKRNAEVQQKAQQNLKAGQDFLANNKKQPGVVTLPDGLQYKVMTMGTGPKPTQTDTVKVDYTGTLINGTVFDSSEKQGQPISFKVNQVIKGWTEVLQLMPVGSTWQVFIPADLAYGAQAVGNVIGPNETLIFTIHLISIEKAN